MGATGNATLAGLGSMHGCSTDLCWTEYSVGPAAFSFQNGQKFAYKQTFSNWVKLSDVLNHHSKPAHHCEAVPSTVKLKTTIENPASRIYVMTNHTLQSETAQNEHMYFAWNHSFPVQAGVVISGQQKNMSTLRRILAIIWP